MAKAKTPDEIPEIWVSHTKNAEKKYKDKVAGFDVGDATSAYDDGIRSFWGVSPGSKTKSNYQRGIQEFKSNSDKIARAWRKLEANVDIEAGRRLVENAKKGLSE